MNAAATPTLETPRLRLRPLHAGDAIASAALLTPQVTRGVAGWPVAFSVEMASAWIEALGAAVRSRDAAAWAVTLRADAAPGGPLIGWVTLRRDPDRPRRGGFGYWLGEAHQGRGYMREAAPRALAAGFAILDLEAVEAAAPPGHTASIAVMRACGMRRVGEVWIAAPDEGLGEGRPGELYIIYGVSSDDAGTALTDRS